MAHISNVIFFPKHIGVPSVNILRGLTPLREKINGCLNSQNILSPLDSKNWGGGLNPPKPPAPLTPKAKE